MPVLSRFTKLQSVVLAKLAGRDEAAWSVPTYVARVVTDAGEQVEVQVADGARKQWAEMDSFVAYNVEVPGLR